MKCPKCKAKADEEDEYCKECGTLLKTEEKEGEEGKGISMWALLVWFIVFLILFGSLYFYLTERKETAVQSQQSQWKFSEGIPLTKEEVAHYFIETKDSCEEADINAGVDAGVLDISKDLVKKKTCVDKCQKQGYVYSDYGCKNNVFVCYCN